MTVTAASGTAAPDPRPTYPLGSYLVHRVGFGAMQLPGPGVMGPPRDRDAALGVLRRAVELGVDHIDTAQFYGPDVANELIRDALYPYPDGLALVSKVGAERDSAGAWLPALHPAQLRAGVEDNLRTLRVEQLAAVNLRLPEHGDSDTPRLEDQLAEMVALREEGKIAGVGLSNATLEQTRTGIDLADIVCVQNPFNLLDRSGEDVLTLCQQADVAFVPFFPLGSAFPGMPKVTDDRTVQQVAARLGATPPQVGLAWLLARSPNILLIPGTSSAQHLAENLDCLSVDLGPDDLTSLDACFVPPAGD